MIVCACDPGFSGAVAFLELSEPYRVLGVVDMPTAKKASGRRELLLHELVSSCREVLGNQICGHMWIERQVPFGGGEAAEGKAPRMGASSAFSLGGCQMAVEMMAVCFGWPKELVMPGVWKRHFGIGKDKALARARASELLPADRHLWTPRRGGVNTEHATGRAEAVLLGLYGVHTTNGRSR